MMLIIFLFYVNIRLDYPRRVIFIYFFKNDFYDNSKSVGAKSVK